MKDAMKIAVPMTSSFFNLSFVDSSLESELCAGFLRKNSRPAMTLAPRGKLTVVYDQRILHGLVAEVDLL